MGTLNRSAAGLAALVLLTSATACASGNGRAAESPQIVHPGMVVLYGQPNDGEASLVSDSTAVTVRAGEVVSAAEALTIAGDASIVVKSVEPLKSVGLTEFETISKSTEKPGRSLSAVSAEIPKDWNTGSSKYEGNTSAMVGVSAAVDADPGADWIGAIDGLRITYEVDGSTQTIVSDTQFCWSAKASRCDTAFPLK